MYRLMHKGYSMEDIFPVIRRVFRYKGYILEKGNKELSLKLYKEHGTLI
jgi:hypothetical protein